MYVRPECYSAVFVEIGIGTDDDRSATDIGNDGCILGYRVESENDKFHKANLEDCRDHFEVPRRYYASDAFLDEAYSSFGFRYVLSCSCPYS